MKARAAEWLRAQGAERVDEALAARLHIEFPELTERLGREACFECGLALDAMVELVRQDTFEELERTLGALGEEYGRGDRARKGQARQAVITARRHALWSLKNPKVSEERHAEKREMELWMETWLRNPELFGVWVGLRRRALER